MNGEKVLVLHRNVDLDAVVSAYLYLKVVEQGVVFTEENLSLEELKQLGVTKLVILDMPLKEEIAKKAQELGIEIEHYDHHDGSAPSTARILWEKFRTKLPEWTRFIVELADYSDTGQILRLPAPAKYFHLTGYINALRTSKLSDSEIIQEVFRILDIYKLMLQKLVEAEELVKDIPIFEIGGVRVAIVENGSHTINQTLFELKGVDLIIFKDGNNLGITRNATINEPDLNKLKPLIAKELEKRNPEELKEWFFHPQGFLVARGTRKHPAKTPSVLTPHDLLRLLSSIT